MMISALFVVSMALGSPPDALEARRTVERSLPYIQKEGVSWIKNRKFVLLIVVPIFTSMVSVSLDPDVTSTRLSGRPKVISLVPICPTIVVLPLVTSDAAPRICVGLRNDPLAFCMLTRSVSNSIEVKPAIPLFRTTNSKAVTVSCWVLTFCGSIELSPA